MRSRGLALAGLAAALAVGSACGGDAPEPTSDAPAAEVPERPAMRLAEPVGPGRRVQSPLAKADRAELDRVRGVLSDVVAREGLDLDTPWAVGHALLALGPDAALPDGQPAVDALFARWARRRVVDGHPLLAFPKQADGRPVAPHSGLMIKAMTDLGLSPTRAVTVEGEPGALAQLWRGTLAGAWVDGETTAWDGWNDAPWVLHALSAWAPEGLAWTTADGHAMTLDGFTTAALETLERETAFLVEARAAGGTFQKERQGIFAYTCGGAHLLQGVAHAVGAGFGPEDGRARMVAQAELAVWRFPRELAILDQAMQQAPQYALILTVQRLKFVGHHIETLHRMAALGLLPEDTAPVAQSLEDAYGQLVATVDALSANDIFSQLDAVRAQREQTWLDIIGDSAHAVKGLDLAAGRAVVWLPAHPGVPSEVATE